MRHIIDAYVEAWNEPLEDKRRQTLARVMAEGCTYVDPNTELSGRAALSGYIGEVLGNNPGRRIVRTSEVDTHHRVCRFHWLLVRADGTRGAECVDFAEFDGEGRIARVIGFFGPLTQTEPT